MVGRWWCQLGTIFVAIFVAGPAFPSSEANQATSSDPSDARASADHDLQLLRATQQVFREAAAEVSRYMVRIDTVGGAQPVSAGERASGGDEQPNPFREAVGSDFVIADGPTSGVIYDASGYIVTSSFNFVRDPVAIDVTLPDGRRLAADLVARDHVRKIALLKVDAEGLATPRWKSVDQVQVGQWALAMGYGFGSGTPSVTVGIVSALNRMNGNAVQTDAKLSTANYGGPLCDIEGRIIGICVPMAQRPGELAGVEMYDSGVGFVVPQPRLDEIVAVLRTGKSLQRGWLGIQLDPRNPHAAVISNLADPSPMREAGALPGDVIVSANGRPVQHFGQLVQAIYMIPAGEAVEVVIRREEETMTLNVVLARNTDLGPLPEAEEPFDPSVPQVEEAEEPGEGEE